jgi:hypothetical protein
MLTLKSVPRDFCEVIFPTGANRMFRKIAVLLLTTLSLGCVNAYRDFYQSFLPSGDDARALPGYDTTVSGVQVFGSADMERDIWDWAAKGYIPVGQASFSGSGNYITVEDAKVQAKAVGAHVVLMSSKYSHTNSGAVPLYVPNTSTSYTSGSATVTGPYGTATGYGSATTTTQSSTVMMMPYSVAMYEASAVFMVRRKYMLGLVGEKAPEEFHKKNGSYQGVQVKIVVEGAPAFKSGIMRGDILMSIGPVPMFTEGDISSAVEKLGPGPTTIELIRDGKRVKKSVVIDPP